MGREIIARCAPRGPPRAATRTALGAKSAESVIASRSRFIWISAVRERHHGTARLPRNGPSNTVVLRLVSPRRTRPAVPDRRGRRRRARASAADRVALLTARACTGPQHNPRPRGHRHRVVVAEAWVDLEHVAAAVELRQGGVAERLLDGEVAGPPLARVERAREVLGVEARRVDRLPAGRRRRRRGAGRRAAPTGPAGRRPACRTRATARRHAARAWARASCAAACRGASDVRAGPPRARTSARACRAASPSRGSAGELCSQPPLGVAETMLP